MATLTDKLLFIPTIGLILGEAFVAALLGPFRSSDAAPTYLQHVGNTLVRGLCTHCSIGQIQWLVPKLVDTYKSWCSKHSLQPDVVPIPNTTISGCWLGSKSTATYTMVYFHGGGFVFPGSVGHLDMLLNFIKWSNNSLAIFCVAYDLSPSSLYPIAIGQCVEALRYTLSLPGHSPSNTLLGGDSAGGNLVLAVLSHIDHPHPQADIVRRLELDNPLYGAVAIAPWTSSDTAAYPSMTKFQYRDVVNATCANHWIEAYKGVDRKVVDDEYICPAIAAPQWWKGVKCQQLLVVAGEEEILVDAISDWVEKYKLGAGNEKIKYVLGVRETHVQCLSPLPEAKLVELGEKTQEGAIRLWIKERLV